MKHDSVITGDSRLLYGEGLRKPSKSKMSFNSKPEENRQSKTLGWVSEVLMEGWYMKSERDRCDINIWNQRAG